MLDALYSYYILYQTINLLPMDNHRDEDMALRVKNILLTRNECHIMSACYLIRGNKMQVFHMLVELVVLRILYLSVMIITTNGHSPGTDV
jgi:hypothetical protein